MREARSSFASGRRGVTSSWVVLNYDTWPFGNATPYEYDQWDWTRLTDLLTPYTPSQRRGVFQLAVQHGVRAITQRGTLDITTKFLIDHNTSDWAKWIDREVSYVAGNSSMVRGVDIDVEGMADKCKGQPRSCRERLSQFTCDLSAALLAKLPNASLSSALAAVPLQVQSGYDFFSMAGCLDYLAVMEYSFASRSTPGATLPLRWVAESVEQYASLNISAQKLVLLLPWYGHDWICKPPLSMEPTARDVRHLSLIHI